MDITRILQGTSLEDRIVDLIRDGQFDMALKKIGKIKSIERRAQIAYHGLLKYSLKLLEVKVVDMTTDRAEFERFHAVVKPENRSSKWVFYQNPETGIIEGGDDLLIEGVVPKDNPVYIYLEKTCPSE